MKARCLGMFPLYIECSCYSSLHIRWWSAIEGCRELQFLRAVEICQKCTQCGVQTFQLITIGKMRKNFFFFLTKKMFKTSHIAEKLKMSHNAEKLKNTPFRLIKRFYKQETSKKCKGYPLIEFGNFAIKKSDSVSLLLLAALKNCGSVRENNTISCFSES